MAPVRPSSSSGRRRAPMLADGLGADPAADPAALASFVDHDISGLTAGGTKG